MSDFIYYGHGKLLLTGEYFLLDGAKGLACPSNFGQQLRVSYKRSHNPKLNWKSFDQKGNTWLETSFELWRFNCLGEESLITKTLQKILIEARKLNVHFLRDEADIYAQTQLEFPLEWGLGSSSTLVYNIAQWAYVSPYELYANTFGGSGYDIACAQSDGPIFYSLNKNMPNWEKVNFNPFFKDNLYFVYLNNKQQTSDAINRYKEMYIPNKKELSATISSLTVALAKSLDLKEFEEILLEHEQIISHALDLPRSQQLFFDDYWGVIKSLGAWGGDFVLATSSRTKEETIQYFKTRGYETIIPYDQMILADSESKMNFSDSHYNANFVGASNGV